MYKLATLLDPAIGQYLKTASVYDQAFQDPVTGQWKFVDKTGYVRLYNDRPTPATWMEYQLEHRKVMEDSIKRALLNEEIIHHIDGNRQNNALENLKLLANHLEHIRQEHPEWRAGIG